MKTHFSFDGHTGRSLFWGTTLISVLCLGVLLLVSTFIIGMGMVYPMMLVIGILALVASCIGYIWVYIAVAVKRCRDAGINPLWTIATVLPYIGLITFIVIGVLPTEKRD